MSDVKVTNAPERVYLNLGDGLPQGECDFTTLHEVTWCADKQGPHDLEYVPLRSIDTGELQRRKRRITSEFLAASGVVPTGRTLDALHKALDAMLDGDARAGCAVPTHSAAGAPDT